VGLSHFPLRDLRQNLEFLRRGVKRDVVCSEADFIANIDVSRLLAYHRNCDFDVTLVGKSMGSEEETWESMLHLDMTAEQGLVGWGDKKGLEHDPSMVYLGMLVIKCELLDEIVASSPFVENMDMFEFLADNKRHIRMGVFEHTGFYRKISSIESYFRSNMDLLEPSVHTELFNTDNPILTKIKDTPPTKYRTTASVSNCLIASGCLIDGTVSGSVISRGVRIEEGAHVRDCVIMQRSQIGKNARLENVILDKHVIVNDNVILKGDPGEPVVIGKNAVV